jgi:hypothetical protein
MGNDIDGGERRSMENTGVSFLFRMIPSHEVIALHELHTIFRDCSAHIKIILLIEEADHKMSSSGKNESMHHILVYRVQRFAGL